MAKKLTAIGRSRNYAIGLKTLTTIPHVSLLELEKFNSVLHWSFANKGYISWMEKRHCAVLCKSVAQCQL